MRTRCTFRAVFGAVSAAGLLAACGGGGDGDGGTSAAGASTSSQAFVAFIAAMHGGRYDDAAPVDLSDFQPPPDDADQDAPAPTPVDE